ncbi:glycoside hydrolase family 108 protein [Chelativorans sp. AA-79]|uniref:glycoside hydrolase family 108 protein n=1 Tax=Chelativorans sp. AA-79 TaxID=3028735 RepID=UPI0023F8701E|nr:glycoside hydrolase family 108 protein [Chelativorans sp. AA-79]WEX11213.1 glycoside hydrolase family 108 protein [Chelativorans sp. AA-79]
MDVDFNQVIPYVLEEEGGYVNDPHDPGGATNMGITLATLSAWEGRSATPQDVEKLTKKKAIKIYRTEFWSRIDGDSLPGGVDYATFDFAVNSGPVRAARMLQSVVNVHEDGIVGAHTLAALTAQPPKDVVNDLCDARKTWLQGLSTASTFGKGWLARVERVRKRALVLADDKPAPASDSTPANAPTPKAQQSDAKSTSMPKHSEARGSMGSAISGVAATVTSYAPVKYAFAAIMAACATAGLRNIVKRIRNES